MKICRLRPVEELPQSQEEKNANAIEQEIARKIDQLPRTIFTSVRRTGQLDVESHRDAGTFGDASGSCQRIARVASPSGPSAGPTHDCRPCGQQAHYHGLRSKTVLTSVGAVEIARRAAHSGAGGTRLWEVVGLVP
jgi:hypothetical protein